MYIQFDFVHIHTHTHTHTCVPIITVKVIRFWVVSVSGTDSWLRKLAVVCSRRSCWGEGYYPGVAQCSCREGLLQGLRWCSADWCLFASDQAQWPCSGCRWQLGQVGGTACENRASGGDCGDPEKHAGVSHSPFPHPPLSQLETVFLTENAFRKNISLDNFVALLVLKYSIKVYKYVKL